MNLSQQRCDFFAAYVSKTEERSAFHVILLPRPIRPASSVVPPYSEDIADIPLRGCWHSSAMLFPPVHLFAEKEKISQTMSDLFETARIEIEIQLTARFTSIYLT